MTDTRKTIQNTRFLKENQGQVKDDLTRQVGPQLCAHLIKVIKVAGMFSLQHNQTANATRDFATWLQKQFDASGEDRLNLQLTDTNLFLNGQLIRFDERVYARTVQLRSYFLGHGVNQIAFRRGIGAGELLSLVQALKEIADGERKDLESFRQPNLILENVAADQAVQIQDTDERREIIELYAGLLIKCSSYFQQVRKSPNPSARFVKRLIQRITDELSEHGDVFVGLINLKLVTGRDFVHAAHSALYAMLLAHEIKLAATDIVRVGMTAITQDIHRVRSPLDERDDIQIGADAHFQTNLTSVITLSEMGGGDVLSALRLVTSYERGFPHNRPLPAEWYHEELRPHLLSRIIEIAGHFDILTQGLEGTEAMTPDMALQALLSEMGTRYDANLVKLFVNILGIYPVGSTVLLTTGEHALIVRSPATTSKMKMSMATRPVVRLLDGSERILNLSEPRHNNVRIAKIVDRKSLDTQPTAFFLF